MRAGQAPHAVQAAWRQKIRAAEIAGRANIPTYILSGEDPENLYRIFDGEDIGTVFMP